MRSPLLAITLVLSLPAIASADMIPSCPPGQHAQMNPVQPGAMHHAGGSCVPDHAPTEPRPTVPPATEPQPAEPPAEPAQSARAGEAAPEVAGCSVAARASGSAWIVIAGVAGLLFAARRSRALTARTAPRRRPGR